MNAEISSALGWHLEPFRRPGLEHQSVPLYLYIDDEDSAQTKPAYSYFWRNEFRYKESSPEAILNFLLWDIHAAVARHVRDYLLLHAAAVARGGRALLLPAARNAGKSSLAAALLLEGFDYLSDEHGAIDPITGKAFPFPKMISLDPDAIELFPELRNRQARPKLSENLPELFVRPEDLSAIMSTPAPPAWIVFPSDDFSGAPRLTSMSSAEAVTAMAANALNLYRFSERGPVLLARVAKEAKSYYLVGGTPRERAALLAERLS